MIENKHLYIEYHEQQRDLFFRNKARFKVIPKGRRFGLTHGFMMYAIDMCINPKNKDGEKILWVDTTFSNITKYIQRYGLPLLKNIHQQYWNWNRTNNELHINISGTDSMIDFRSADRPENFEGFGYTLVILNEAGIILKNPNLWLESIRPMMLDYKADALIGGTPKGKTYRGKEHLFYTLSKKAGEEPTELFPEATEQKKNWATINYSSYDNPMLDKGEIDEMASEISPVLRDQQIYGLFVDSETDRIIKREWFETISNLRHIKNPYVIQSWDTAFKKNEENDYSVCTTWYKTEDKYYLIDIFRERMEFPELKKKVVELSEEFKPNEIIIEDKASGISLLQELQRNTVLPIKAIKVSKDKVTRVHSITPIIKAGNVVLYIQSDNVNELLDESEDFPNGEYDDMVDSMSQALEYMRVQPKVIAPKKTMTKKYRKRKIY